MGPGRAPTPLEVARRKRDEAAARTQKALGALRSLEHRRDVERSHVPLTEWRAAGEELGRCDRALAEARKEVQRLVQEQVQQRLFAG